MTIVARFNSCLNPEGAITTCWTYRDAKATPYQGAQVLDVEHALWLIEEGYDRTDDWYSAKEHTELLLIKVSGFSGDRGPLNYDAITEGDVIEVRSIDTDEISNLIYGLEHGLYEGELEDLVWEEAYEIEPTYHDPTTILKEAV